MTDVEREEGALFGAGQWTLAEGVCVDCQETHSLSPDRLCSLCNMRRAFAGPISYAPPPVVVHPSILCGLQIEQEAPEDRPRDFDAWAPEGMVWRPLRCANPGCKATLSRNCPRRWDTPYCGPHWPGQSGESAGPLWRDRRSAI